MKAIHKQNGIALVMSLIMLLLITIVGVASVRMTSLDTQVSGNSLYSLMVFQGAESGLGKIASNDDISNIRDAALNTADSRPIPDSYFTPIETVNDGAELNTKGVIAFESDVDGLYGGLPNAVGVGEAGIKYRIFRTTVETKLNATAAKAVHIEGIAISKSAQ